MNMHLLIPMSGQGTRYQQMGYNLPKPLIPVNGKPMIERLLEVMPKQWHTHFVVAENHADSGLIATLRDLRPDANIVIIGRHGKGPGHACLAALGDIPPEDPVLVSYCDYGMVWDPVQFERFVEHSECDSCLVSYRGFHAHYINPQTYAYARLVNSRVVEVKEKGSFTDDREQEHASSGAYYFKTARQLKAALDYQIKKDISLNGEYYTSLTVQALLDMEPSSDVRVFEVPAFFQWGTPADLRDYEYWERTFAGAIKNSNRKMSCDQVLMPMAGRGSRFADVSEWPKPFIPIDGALMFEAALATLPQAESTVIVALKEHEALLGPPVDGRHIVLLDNTPSGQALSTFAGISALQPKKNVVVSSCDHGIVLNDRLWRKFLDDPQCDAAIFTIRGFPLAVDRPSSFAYVIPRSGDDSPIPEVSKVSVKLPVSSQPDQDHVLVGTFWFRSTFLLQEACEDLFKHDVRVNGELYLDSVFSLMMAKGLSVRMIPLDGYIGWGDPNSLAVALYWQEVFGGHRIGPPRARFPGVKQC
jgi:NDP-sugar pyrophosphorylase family protein